MAHVFDQFGPTKTVKNLGWLTRHMDKVTMVEVDHAPDCEAILTAHLSDGRRFVIRFLSYTICRAWVTARRTWTYNEVTIRFN